MRALTPPPSSVVDPHTGDPRTGSFRGPLPSVDLGPMRRSRLYRLLHGKRWIYTAVSNDRVFAGVALVDLGYAGNAFAFVWEPGREGFLAERSALAAPGGCSVIDQRASVVARFAAKRQQAEMRLVRGRSLEVHVRFDGLEIDATMDLETPRPALSAIGPIPGGAVDATEKHALLDVRGAVRVGARRESLDDAVGGYDYTHGYLARHTRWRWGYLLGRAQTGQRIAMNLVEGFLGENECGVWVDDALHPIGEGRFLFDASKPSSPWRVRSADGALNLSFRPHAVHAESRNLWIVRSHFVQPVGTYEGTIRVGEESLVIDRAYGVAEDQDIVW